MRRKSSIPFIHTSSLLDLDRLKMTHNQDDMLDEQLLQKKLSQVLQEPKKLDEQDQAIQNDLELLIYKHCPDIINVHSTNIKINQSIHNLQSSLSLLTQSLDTLSTATLELTQKIPDLVIQRDICMLLNNQQDMLAELLTSASLLGELVDEGFYEDALDTLFFIEKLANQYSKLDYMQKILSDIQPVVLKMNTQLVHLFKSDNKLPLFIRVVGFLKKLNFYTEQEISILFVKSRGECMFEVIESIDQQDPQENIKSFIEVSREHIFDISTQYMAIFKSQENSFGISVLSSFMLYWQKEFMRRLKEKVGLLDSMLKVGSVHLKCMYFGMSLGRIGLDFRMTLVQVFEQRIIELFKEDLNNTTKEFILTVKSEGAECFRSLDDMKIDDFDRTFGSGFISPSYQVLQFGVLAHYHNQIFTLFNQMRCCALLSVCNVIANELGQRLKVAGESIALMSGSSNRVSDVIYCFESHFLPSIIAGFHQLFPGEGKLIIMQDIILSRTFVELE